MSWTILIEEQRSQKQYYQVETKTSGRLYGTQEQARHAARGLSYEHEPRDPKFPKGRKVYRVDPDHYIVQIQGITGWYTFKLTVCEELPDA